MYQPIRDGDYKFLGGSTSTLIGFIIVEVSYATIDMLSSKNHHTWYRLERIESTNSRNILSCDILCDFYSSSGLLLLMFHLLFFLLTT